MISKDIQKELLNYDKNHIWHPYTSANAALPCYLADSADGVYINLTSGKKLIDGMSSWWAAIHGYNNTYLNNAVKAQLKKMSHVMFGGLAHVPAIELAKKLLNILPHGLEHIFYCDSGSIAVEVALKMALQYWHALGNSSKCKFATVCTGYHGDTWHAMSVCDPVTGMHSIFNNRLPIQYFVETPSCKFEDDWEEDTLNEIKKLFENHHKEIAAFIIEPIAQGAGGMYFYHPKYLKGLYQLCKQYDILFIADEIATGFGRTGKMFACEWANITPDIVCVGKALTGGYISMAATITTKHVASIISQSPPHVFMHGPTFMGNPLACAVANASLDIIMNNQTLEKVKKIESQIKLQFTEARGYPFVNDVRVLGAIGVIEMKKAVDIKKIQSLFVANGVWIRPFGKLAYIMPPYIINENELSQLIDGMLKSLIDYDFN